MKARSSRKSKFTPVLYVTLVFVVVILLGLLLPRMFTVVGAAVMTPVHVVSQWYETSEDALAVLFRDKNSLQAEIDRLENELLIANGARLSANRLWDENTRLRALLGDSETERTMARVIARPDELPYDLLQIDRGTIHGITEQAYVYVGEDQLIGTVISVKSHYSMVELFTTPGAELTGFISGPDVTATIEGVGGGVARVRVPQGIPLNIGDLVYVPSVEPGLFGRIDFVENRPSQPEQFGYITLPVSLQSLFEVAISQQPAAVASVETIQFGIDSIISQRLLVEEANTSSFEDLLATSSNATSVEENDI